jgi:hypothetical protein
LEYPHFASFRKLAHFRDGAIFSFSDCDKINTNLRSVSFHKFRTIALKAVTSSKPNAERVQERAQGFKAYSPDVSKAQEFRSIPIRKAATALIDIYSESAQSRKASTKSS